MRPAVLLVLLLAAGCAPDIVPVGPGPGLCPEGGACDEPPIVIITEGGDAGDGGDAGEEAGPPLDRVPDPTAPAPSSTPELGGAGGATRPYLGGAGGAGGGQS